MRDGVLSFGCLGKLKSALAGLCNAYIDSVDNSPDFSREVWIHALDTADLVLVCLTPAILTSPWVQFEIERASTLCKPILALDAQLLITSVGRRSALSASSGLARRPPVTPVYRGELPLHERRVMHPRRCSPID